MKCDVRRDFTREDMELICYIIYTQSEYHGTGISSYNEDQIKWKVRKKIKHGSYEFWTLNENAVFFITFVAIYLTHMKLKQ
jgi:hypothetical protein